MKSVPVQTLQIVDVIDQQAERLWARLPGRPCLQRVRCLPICGSKFFLGSPAPPSAAMGESALIEIMFQPGNILILRSHFLSPLMDRYLPDPDHRANRHYARCWSGPANNDHPPFSSRLRHQASQDWPARASNDYFSYQIRSCSRNLHPGYSLILSIFSSTEAAK